MPSLRPATAIWVLGCLSILLFLSGCRKLDDRNFDPGANYPVKGIDISAHNGNIDFEKVAESGIKFVFIKATEGSSFKDKLFVTNYNNARKAGLKVGAYHFFRFNSPGYLQGLNLVNSIQGRKLELPIVIDVEDAGNPAPDSAHGVALRLNEMIKHLEEHGYSVMIYTNKMGYKRYIRNRVPDSSIWLCSLAQEPDQGMNWTFWQYSHHGKVPGITGYVDKNVFQGSEKAFDQVFSFHE